MTVEIAARLTLTQDGRGHTVSLVVGPFKTDDEAVEFGQLIAEAFQQTGFALEIIRKQQ